MSPQPGYLINELYRIANGGSFLFSVRAMTEKKYLVKTLDGQQYGPVDQECLVRWVKTGRVTRGCQIRSTLLARWETAAEVRFLREHIEAQERATVAVADVAAPTFWDKLKTRATMRGTRSRTAAGIHETKAADFQAAPIWMRVASGLSDLVVVLLLGAGVFLAMAYLCSVGLDANSAFYLGTALFYAVALLYFAWTVYLSAQTVGNKLWGLLVIRAIDEDLLLGRCFLYALGVICVGFLTPLYLFVLATERAPQEGVSGTRVVKTRFVHKRPR